MLILKLIKVFLPSSLFNELTSQLVNDARRESEWDGGELLFVLSTLFELPCALESKIDCADRWLVSISLFFLFINNYTDSKDSILLIFGSLRIRKTLIRFISSLGFKYTQEGIYYKMMFIDFNLG